VHPKTIELQERTRQFAAAVIAFCNELHSTLASQRITIQLLDSAGATDSNYRAACRARSGAEFIAKLGIAIEEGDESKGWLELLVASSQVAADTAAPLIQESERTRRDLHEVTKDRRSPEGGAGTAGEAERKPARTLTHPALGSRPLVNQQPLDIRQPVDRHSTFANPSIGNRQSALANPSIGNRHSPIRRSAIGIRHPSIGNRHSPIRRSAIDTRQSVDRQSALANPSIGPRHSPIRRSAIGIRQPVDRQSTFANPSIGNRHSPMRRSAIGIRQPSIGTRHSPIRRSAIGIRQSVDRQSAFAKPVDRQSTLANPSIGNRHSPIGSRRATPLPRQRPSAARARPRPSSSGRP